MIKVIGAVLILGASGSFAICKAAQFFRQLGQLRQMLGAIEIIKCELNYTLRPLPQLCRHAAKRVSGAVSVFFLNYAHLLDSGLPRTKATQKAFEETRGLSLPPDAQMAVLELCTTIGRYDLDGENRMLQLSGQRLRSAIERFDSEKRPMAKSYAVLGFTTGLALVILFA